MIISHKYKCIFIRVPKTGSTSIEKLWKIIDSNCQISDDDMPPYGHYKCSELKRVIGEEIWNNYFKFAFIREPKDWFKSQYTDNMKYEHEASTKLHILLNEHYMLDNPINKVLSLDHCISLHVFLNNWFRGKDMSSYLDLEVDYVGLLENFHEDLTKIFKKIGYNDHVEIPHERKSPSNEYSFDEDSNKFLDILLKKDIELYNKVKNDF
jgi:hypothetical protein